MSNDHVPVCRSSTIADANHEFSDKVRIARMLQRGAIVEVTDADEAKTAEEAGAFSIVIHHGTPRMPDPSLIKEIKQAVSIPVMARVRIGHFVEAQIVEASGVDYIDESELLNNVDNDNYINKHKFRVLFACACVHLEQAFARVAEGAVLILMQGGQPRWTKSGSIVETIRTVRSVMNNIRNLTNMDEDEVFTFAKKMGAPYDLITQTKQLGRLPVLQFAVGGIETPADAALMMQLGCDGVLIESKIYDCSDPCKKIRAIVEAVRHYNDPYVLAQISSGLDDSEAEDSDDLIGFLL